MEERQATHEVIDLTLPEHGAVYEGTEEQCHNFIADQDTYGYMVVPIVNHSNHY